MSKLLTAKKVAFSLVVGAVMTACGSTYKTSQPNLSSADINPDAQELALDGTPISSDMSQQIVKGDEARAYSLPYQALVKNYTEKGDGFYLCGGTFIAKNVVLTAAHCVDDTTADRVKVGAGVHNRKDRNDGEYLDTSRIIVHSKWNKRPSRGYDIALIILKTDFTTPNAKVAYLPSPNVDRLLTLDGKRGVISGWGRTAPGSLGKSSDVLRTTNIPISVNTDCGRGGLPQGTICGLKDRGQDTCQGDSGGPLVSKYERQNYVLGIVSFGPITCSGNGVYTRVASYLDWISQKTRIVPPTNGAPNIQAPVASFTSQTQGLAVQFRDGSSDADNDIVSWNWDFGDGNSSSRQSPSHRYHKAGTYTVKLTVKDETGLTNSVSKVLHIVNADNDNGGGSGSNTYSGTVTSSRSYYAPDKFGFQYNGGTLVGDLNAPSSVYVDVDLVLERKTEYGRWNVVARSSKYGNDEHIEKDVSAGVYRWKVYTYSRGAGEFTLKVKR